MSLSAKLLRTKPIVADDGSVKSELKRVLSATDLMLLGIGAIIGAGIFVRTGQAAANLAGPAVVLSFVLAGFACACAALSYAELAASVGGAGSAYGYGYAGLGELPAWVIGWMLLLEYLVSVSTVSSGWSGYLVGGLNDMGIHLPVALTHGPWDLQQQGVINLPASLIILVLGGLLLSGAKMSAVFNAVIVSIKLTAIAVFIGVAAFHVNPAYWHPFIPPVGPNAHGETAYGVSGIFTAASKIFFAYLGFDAVSTAAEETRNPQRDLPIGIIGSLALCTVIYIIVSGLLTGITPYLSLNNDHPVTKALVDVGANWAAGLITIGAVAGLTTVMLVMYYGLTRVLMAISRDGLLPGVFSRVNAGGNPHVAIISTGLIMSLLGGLVPLDELGDIANIGTLGAFVIACVGVIVLRRTRPDLRRPFRVPGGAVLPVLGILSCGFLMINLGALTWKSFAVWMAIGLVVYFTYSRKHSVLARSSDK